MTSFTTKTSMDGIVRAITTGFAVLTGVIFVVQPIFWFGVGLVVVGIISLVLNPTQYTVRDGLLLIERPIGAIEIRLSDIIAAKEITRLPYIRVFGIGGLFGYYGLYWSKETGTVRMYGRNRRHPILLDLRSARRTVLMPDDLEVLKHLAS
jgi:hypothetical protein